MYKGRKYIGVYIYIHCIYEVFLLWFSGSWSSFSLVKEFKTSDLVKAPEKSRGISGARRPFYHYRHAICWGQVAMLIKFRIRRHTAKMHLPSSRLIIFIPHESSTNGTPPNPWWKLEGYFSQLLGVFLFIRRGEHIKVGRHKVTNEALFITQQK